MKEENFNIYYRKYEKMIHHLLHRYQIHYHYEDYFQLLVIKLWDLLKTYDETKTCNQEQYIYLKLKFYLIDCMRKYVKESNRFLPTSDYNLLDQSYVENFDCNLYCFLDMLSHEELTWFKLNLNGYSTHEIAIYMDKSVSTVKYYRKNAREKLKFHFLF